MQRKFKISVDGRSYEVVVEEVTEASSLLPQPGDMHIPEPAPPPVQFQAQPSGQPGDLCSPLAGVIESLLVVVGQQVEAGQQVAVIEAMKMKTSVVAHFAGRITAVAVGVEDAVETGQLLMSIE